MSRQGSGYHGNRKDRRENQQKPFGIGSWYGTGEYHTGFNKSSGDYVVPSKRSRSTDRYNQRSQSTDDQHMKVSQQDNDYGLYTDFSADGDREQQMEKTRGSRTYMRGHHSVEYEKSHQPHGTSRNFSQSDVSVYRQQHSSSTMPTGRDKQQGTYYQDTPSYKTDSSYQPPSYKADSSYQPQPYKTDLNYQWKPTEGQAYRSRNSRQYSDVYNKEEYVSQSVYRPRDNYLERSESQYVYDKESALYGSHKELPSYVSNVNKRTPSKEDFEGVQPNFQQYPGSTHRRTPSKDDYCGVQMNYPSYQGNVVNRKTPTKDEFGSLQTFTPYMKSQAEKISELQAHYDAQKYHTAVESNRDPGAKEFASQGSRGYPSLGLKEYPTLGAKESLSPGAKEYAGTGTKEYASAEGKVAMTQARRDESPRKGYGSKFPDPASPFIGEQKGGVYSGVLERSSEVNEQFPGIRPGPLDAFKVSQNVPRNEEGLQKKIGELKGFPASEQHEAVRVPEGSNKDEKVGGTSSAAESILEESPTKSKIDDEKPTESPLKASATTNVDQDNANKKPESSEPKTTDTENDDKRPITEEEIVSKLDKMDKDILECEQNIDKLQETESKLEKDIERLKEEFENSDNTEKIEEKNEIKSKDTRDELMEYFIDKFRSRDTDLVTKIYKENKMKAKLAHSKLGKLNLGSTLSSKPLYNQPSDLPFYYENIRKHKQFRKKLVSFLRIKKLAVIRSDELMKQKYQKQKDLWLKKVDKIENNIKRRTKLAKVRAFYEREFPEIKRQREQQERMTRLGSRSSWGAFARSEAEFEEIIDNLTELEATEKHMHQLAVSPPNLLHKFERRVQYRNRNGLIKDVEVFERDRKFGKIWREQERTTFKEKFAQYPKDFAKIAEYLDKKTVPDCVLYYYQNKKKENFKVTSKKTAKKSGRLQRQLVSTLTYAQPVPHIQDVQQPIKTRQKEREREREREREKIKETEKNEKQIETIQTKTNDYQKETRIADEQSMNTADKSACSVPESMVFDAASISVNQDETRQSVDELIAKYLAKKPLLEMVDPSRWSEVEISKAVDGLKYYGRNWPAIAKLVSTKSEAQCKNFYFNYKRKFHLESILGIARQGRRNNQTSTGGLQKQTDENETGLRSMRSHKSLRASNEDMDIPSASTGGDNALRDDEDVEMVPDTTQMDDVENDDDNDDNELEGPEVQQARVEDQNLNDDEQTLPENNMKQDTAVLNRPVKIDLDKLGDERKADPEGKNMIGQSGRSDDVEMPSEQGDKVIEKNNVAETQIEKDKKMEDENSKITDSTSKDLQTYRLLPPPLTPVAPTSTKQPQTTATASVSVASPVLQGISLQSEIGAFKKKVLDMSFTANSNNENLYSQSSPTVSARTHEPVTSKLFQRTLHEPSAQMHLQPRLQQQSLPEAKPLLRPVFVSPSVEQSSVIEAFTARNPPVMTVHAVATTMQSNAAKYPFSKFANAPDGGQVKTMDQNIPRDNIPRDTIPHGTLSGDTSRDKPGLQLAESVPRKQHVSASDKERHFMTLGLGLTDKNIPRRPNEASLRHQDVTRPLPTQQHLDSVHPHMKSAEKQHVLMQHPSQVADRGIHSVPEQFALKVKEHRPRTVSEIHERSAQIPSLSVNRPPSAPQDISRLLLTHKSNLIRFASQLETGPSNSSQFEQQRNTISLPHGNLAASRPDIDIRASTTSQYTSESAQSRMVRDPATDAYYSGIAPNAPFDPRMMPIPQNKGMQYPGMMHEMSLEYASSQPPRSRLMDKRFFSDVELDSRRNLPFSRATVVVQGTANKMPGEQYHKIPHTRGSIDTVAHGSLDMRRRSLDTTSDPKYHHDIEHSVQLGTELYLPRYSDAITDPRYGISTGLVQKMPHHASITGMRLDSNDAIRQYEAQLNKAQLHASLGHLQPSSFQDFDPRQRIVSSKTTARIKRTAKNGRPSSVDSVIQKSMITKAPSSLSLSLCDLTSASCSTPCSPNLPYDDGSDVSKRVSVFRPWERPVLEQSALNDTGESSQRKPCASPKTCSSQLSSVDSVAITAAKQPLSISIENFSSEVSHDEPLMSPTFPMEDTETEQNDEDVEGAKGPDSVDTKVAEIEKDDINERESDDKRVKSDGIWKTSLPVDSQETEQAIDQLLKISGSNEGVLECPGSPTDSEATLSADETKMELMQENIDKYDRVNEAWSERFISKEFEAEIIENERSGINEEEGMLNRKGDGRKSETFLKEGIDADFGEKDIENTLKTEKIPKRKAKNLPGKTKKALSKGTKKSTEKSKMKHKAEKTKNEADLIEKIVRQEREKEAVTDETIETTAAIDSIQPKSCDSTSADEDQASFDLWMSSNVYEIEGKDTNVTEVYDMPDIAIEGNRSQADNVDALNSSNCPSSDEIYHPDYETVPISPPASPITPVDSPKQTEITDPVSSFSHSVLSLSFAANLSHSSSPKSHLNVAFPYSTLSLNVGSRPTSRHSSRPGSTCASPNITTNFPNSPNPSLHRADHNIQGAATFVSQSEHLRHLTEQLLRDDDSIPRNDEPGSDNINPDMSSADSYTPVMTYEPLSDED